MFEITRQMIGYAIIAAILVIGVPLAIHRLNHRRRRRLRRQGIKRFGH